jgi:hypothetical protein
MLSALGQDCHRVKAAKPVRDLFPARSGFGIEVAVSVGLEIGTVFGESTGDPLAHQVQLMAQPSLLQTDLTQGELPKEIGRQARGRINFSGEHSLIINGCLCHKSYLHALLIPYYTFFVFFSMKKNDFILKKSTSYGKINSYKIHIKGRGC